MRETGLVQRARRGDLEAFNQLIARHEAVAFSLAFRLFGDEPTAEAIVQKSVLDAFQRLDEFQGERFLCWLLRIIVDTCQDWQMSSPPKVRRSAVHIEQNLTSLPFEQRLAILLSDVHGFSRQEVALIMGVSDAAARLVIHKARSTLHHFLFGLPVTSSGTYSPLPRRSE